MAEYQNRAAIRLAQARKGSQGEPSGAVLGLSDMLTGQYLKHRQNIFNRTLSNDSRDELSDPSFLQKYQKLTEESQINIDNLTNQIMNSNPKFAQAVELIKQTLIAKGHQDSEELDQVAFQAALQSPCLLYTSNQDELTNIKYTWNTLVPEMDEERTFFSTTGDRQEIYNQNQNYNRLWR